MLKRSPLALALLRVLDYKMNVLMPGFQKYQYTNSQLTQLTIQVPLVSYLSLSDPMSAM